MRIKSIKAENIPPIRNIQIDQLGHVVIIAGANGSGKTKLKDAITQTFNNPNSPLLDLKIEATRPEEREQWGANDIDVVRGTPNQTFVNYMNTRVGGGYYVGTAIQIDSERTIINPQYPTLNLTVPDPDESEIDHRWFLAPFTSKWNEIITNIYQKVASRELKIAKYAKNNPSKTFNDFLKKYPDPFLPYQNVFHKLLPDKTLEAIDPNQPREFYYKTSSGDMLAFSSLSSGEQEVVKVAFYILTKKINHCVFLVDEPELHLHPTLSFRLVETLKELGGNTNQFIFFTHSADLISTYYSTGDVYFIDSDRSGYNQAHRLSELNESHAGLVEMMSENLGLFAVGKKLVFVEGEQSSIDRLTYHAIAQKYFPEAHVIPVESVANIVRLKDFSKEIQKAIFGIDFFMIRDRDGLSEDQVRELEVGKKLLCLKRRHVENYLLDAQVLVGVAKRFFLDQQWYDPTAIESKLKEIAEKHINYSVLLGVKEYTRLNQDFEIPNVKSVEKKSLEEVKNEYASGMTVAIQKISGIFDNNSISKVFTEEEEKLRDSLNSDWWKALFPGKVVFNNFCRDVWNIEPSRVRAAYIEIALENHPTVFQDIINIYAEFKKN